MPRRGPVSVLSALGVDEEDERLYHQLLPLSGTPTAGVAATLGLPGTEALLTTVAVLLERGLASIERDRLVVLPVPEVVAGAIAREAAAAVRTRDRLDALARAVPFLAASGSRPEPGQVEELGGIDGEVSAGGNALHLLTALIEQSRGDLLFCGPTRG